MDDPGRESYVALFDILGFRELVRHQRLTTAVKLIERVRKRAELSRWLGCRSVLFSDSIVLYAEGNDPIHLLHLTHLSCHLVGSALEFQIPLRGALTKGHFYHDEDLLLGPALINAYELEQGQDWAGGILDPAMIASFSKAEQETLNEMVKEEMIHSYRAPIKSGSVGDLYCLGWPGYFNSSGSPSQAFYRWGTPPWDVVRKAQHTEDFFNMCRKRGRYAMQAASG